MMNFQNVSSHFLSGVYEFFSYHGPPITVLYIEIVDLLKSAAFFEICWIFGANFEKIRPQTPRQWLQTLWIAFFFSGGKMVRNATCQR